MGIFDGILIMSDLDGTLLNSAGHVSDGNRDAIEYFIARGGRFSVATGRSYPGMCHLLDQFPCNAPAVVYNGSMGFDFQRMRQVYVKPLGGGGLDLAEGVMANFHDSGVEIYRVDGAYVAQNNFYTSRHIEYVKLHPIFSDARDIPQPWLSMLLTIDPQRMPELRKYVAETFGGMFFTQLSLEYYLEVQCKGADKGTGVLEVARRLGIQADNIYVAGDGANDVELLSCTKNAFAPANACRAVLDMHPRLLPDNDNSCISGLIEYIERNVREHEAI